MRVSLFTQLLKMDEGRYLLLNPVSGNIRVVDNEVADFLSEYSETGLDGERIEGRLLEILKREGYITDFTEEEEKNRILDASSAVSQRPVYAHAIIITYRCNLECSYCINSSLLGSAPSWLNKRISRDSVDKAFAVMKDMKEKTVRRHPIYVTGGEPLLPENRAIVEYILDLSAHSGDKVAANTNGYYLAQYADLFEKYGTFTMAGVTLDGPPTVHDRRRKTGQGPGSFWRIVEGIEAIRPLSIHVGIRVNVDKTNIDALPELVAFFEERGWADDKHFSFCVCRVLRTGTPHDACLLTPLEAIQKIITMHTEGVLPRYMKYECSYSNPGTLWGTLQGKGPLRPRLYYCPGLGETFIYDPHGDIYGCPQLVGNPEYRIGTYAPHFKLEPFLDTLKARTPLNMAECRECTYALLCGGGCGYNAHIEHGSFMSPYCEETEAFLTYWVPFYLKRLIQ
ncbi:MAG: radical SAM protein [Theionarchaea archaeon]|nr:radical SAM protein [Theionarchaea archaeon]MBU7000413.1 radical SAM protein [Theionarchaea archaeon]MBU7021255.1 radical SAM protein [Theionarchaea archaeon]MBU7035302.1 radical SAM protein [Theionarchaea archaeon]MBU7039747.1 radical SAM protein [Theionarchaea archaeon]